MGPPVVIQADSLAKSYGGKHLFDHVAFTIEAGETVAVVGPNGAGKSTLLRILAGREGPDDGHLRIKDGLRTHWFDQHPDVPEGATVGELLAAPLAAPAHLAEELAALEARVADPALYEEPGYERVLERLARLQQEIEVATTPAADAWDTPVARELGLGEAELDQRVASLSGGERTKVLLARTLGPVRPGELLVLDEPTNHLDVASIEWLEDWLAAYDGTALVVSHDRVFLDTVATRVLEVARGRITSYRGNYTDYVALRDQEIDRQRREHAKAQDRLDKTKQVIAQFKHQKRFDGQYASRMKVLEKYLAAIDRTPDPVIKTFGFGLSFEAVDKSSNDVMRLANVTKAYGGTKVLDGAHFEVAKGDRVGLVGANGAGKTTLLKLITGQAFKDGGSVRVAPGVKGLYLAQERDDLDPERTMAEEVRSARKELEDDAIKALVGRFRFNPAVDLQRKVATLSGGERSRLAMIKAILKPSNLLILDEPTNHLDLDAREVVVRALNAYEGTLLVVSHDRYLLDAVTTRTAVLNEGRIEVFPGSFTETRHLHAAVTAPKPPTSRYEVAKKFTDWATGTKHRHGDELELTDEEIAENRSLKSALTHGWLVRMD